MAWETILKIKEEVKKLLTDKERLLSGPPIITATESPNLSKDSNTVCVQFSKTEKKCKNTDILIQCTDPFRCNIEYRNKIAMPIRRIFDLYTPYAVLPYFAISFQKTFVVAHFAQTLDGRIASVEGDSKWIGNQENLIHAHRMRALLDGILIGANTMQSDDPMLTVRHVTGEDPRKIIIGGDNLNIKDYGIQEDEIVSFSQKFNSRGPKFRFKKENNLYDTHEILKKLFELNIFSVYIEGGSITTSTFLRQKSIDQIQVHIAPIILGSGTTGFNFKGVDSLKDATYFKSFRYESIGDQMMFIGEL